MKEIDAIQLTQLNTVTAFYTKQAKRNKAIPETFTLVVSLFQQRLTKTTHTACLIFCPNTHSTKYRMVRDIIMMTAVKDMKNEDYDDDDL